MPSKEAYDRSIISKEGSTINSTYVERKVRIYAIYEPELDSISFCNTISMAAFSFSSMAITIAARNGLKLEILTDILTWVALLSLIMGVWAFKLKTSTLSKIKMDSKDKIDQSATMREHSV